MWRLNPFSIFLVLVLYKLRSPRFSSLGLSNTHLGLFEKADQVDFPQSHLYSYQPLRNLLLGLSEPVERTRHPRKSLEGCILFLECGYGKAAISCPWKLCSGAQHSQPSYPRLE